MTDQQKQPALDELQWRAPEWLAMYGLRSDTVLEYFAQSPFYDRSSNNQVLKMQYQFNAPMMQPQDVSRALESMRGIEFVIVTSNPAAALWVIRKQDRLSPTEVVPLATYFVINENIYMAPSVYAVISSRLLAGTRNLRDALVLAADKLPKFSPSLGYSYAPITQEDDDQVQQHAQEQMMGRALGNALMFDNSQEYLDAAPVIPAAVTASSVAAAKAGAGIASYSASPSSRRNTSPTTTQPPALKRRRTKKDIKQ
ncbi:MED6 mediator subfamily complex component-domain-containing protein [Limtongia smithiae]|uniref:MED6 mediator subfamily complex component-domain-containing protein n=1 Tax=Limtongia smithiae TaxID=1125753 RepID=UPI0034CFBF44